MQALGDKTSLNPIYSVHAYLWYIEIHCDIQSTYVMLCILADYDDTS